MLRFQKIILFLIMLGILLPLYGQQKDVIGHYQSWKWQKNREQLNPQSIPYEKLTAVAYAFFYPLESGEIVGMDPAADRYLLGGEADSLTGNSKPGGTLVDLAHRQGAKVILSIGGWEHSHNFPKVAPDG